MQSLLPVIADQSGKFHCVLITKQVALTRNPTTARPPSDHKYTHNIKYILISSSLAEEMSITLLSSKGEKRKTKRNLDCKHFKNICSFLEEKSRGSWSHQRLPSVEDVGALALEPAKPPPQRSLHLALHGVGLVARHPPPALHLRVTEAPHAGSSPSAFPAGAPSYSSKAPFLPPGRRRQRQRVSRRGRQVLRWSRRVDLDPPVAGASAGESVDLGSGGGEIAIRLRGGGGREVTVGVVDGGFRREGRRRAEVAPVRAVVVCHGVVVGGGRRRRSRRARWVGK